MRGNKKSRDRKGAVRSGDVRFRGEVVGHVEPGSATFVATNKDLRSLYLHGCKDVAEALRTGRGAWTFHLGLMEALRDKGVLFVEVPTNQGPRFRATLDLILGPSGFDIVKGADPLVCLELKHWVRL